MSDPPKRLEMSVALMGRSREHVAGGRRPRANDLQALGRLMFAAYQGTIDYTGESVEAATEEVRKTFAGAYGQFLPQHSYVVERDGILVAASLVTRPDVIPLLAFAMTAPSWKRLGLAKAAIGNAMQDLFEAGETQLQLVVNAKNQSALNLYLSLGFEPRHSDA